MSVNVDLKSSVGSEYAADSPMQFSAENVSVAIPEGGTALDALQATDREVTTSGEGDSVEIESIGGLGRGDAGDGSHWEMSVNGQVETSSPAVTVLKSGDTVTFDFVQ